MSRQFDYNLDCVLPELEKLKGFFEDSLKYDNPNSVHGCFGSHSVFLGNEIQHCCFQIPASAMKLIYEFNKDNIDKRIAELTELEKQINLEKQKKQ